MVQYISKELDARFKTSIGRSEMTKKDHSKTIVDLALSNYLAERKKPLSSDGMDATFRDIAICQIRTFAFAGHDTTSSTICYAFHLLSTHPSIRRLLIAEHNDVLGRDYKQTASLINENPNILNQLPYTLAIVKETLRLYPPASSTRRGEPNHFIDGPDGRQLPTDGFLVWSNSYSIHHDPSYWPEPNEFIPERWLVPEGDRLYPLKGAYRPFEFGPRNCIGQELAMLELRIVLVMTAREFDIVTVYEEWDTLHPRKGPKQVNGDRAYQILNGAAHPSDGLPCRVSLDTT
jgi:sterigmatocystin biosynthesis cytochrome P450 monooxygenase